MAAPWRVCYHAAMLALAATLAALSTAAATSPPAVTFASLLEEMTDRAALARWPAPGYRQMQASSYNRASVRRGEPEWFADSDGVGFLREDDHGGRHEWVAMEWNGPGCLTRLWAPYFYFDFNDRLGPTVRIYLDGASEPTIEARWIELLTNNRWPASYGPAPATSNSFHVPAPLARFTARAGDLYLPIPFARSCRVTFDRPPFYNTIAWRAYEEGTTVETFEPRLVERDAKELAACAAGLAAPTADRPPLTALEPGARRAITLPPGPRAVDELVVRVDPAAIAAHPELLRSTTLAIRFDGEETVWCPLGDCFGSPNALNPFETRCRSVSKDGLLRLRWVMPYRSEATIELANGSSVPIECGVAAESGPWTWDDRSMHFHASWRPETIEPGDRFSDWNFIDIAGQGLLVGDQWSVVNRTTDWWGEGDEKIYVDAAAERGFPDHFGTGTEDYYGWAGGVNPTWDDAFSHPFLANIAVGSGTRDAAEARATNGDRGTTRGYNICARERGLDAIPFRERLVFDMEASPGVTQRGPNDRLAYSAVVFWYARPGATSNRPANPEAARRPAVTASDLDAIAAQR